MRKLLINPFENYSEKALLLIGLLATGLGAASSYFSSIRFDGAIDMHLANSLSFQQAFIDVLINILVIFAMVFIAAKIINPKTRAIDILSASAVSRIPLYLVPLLNLNGMLSNAANQLLPVMTDPTAIENIETSSFILIGVFAILGIAATIWSIALLYNGYKVASNAKGQKAIWYFVGALVVAEIITKIIFYQIK